MDIISREDRLYMKMLAIWLECRLTHSQGASMAKKPKKKAKKSAYA